MKVRVDMNLCQSHGECVLVAPDVFDLGEDDVLTWKQDVEESRRAEVQEAVDACPMLAARLRPADHRHRRRGAPPASIAGRGPADDRRLRGVLVA